MRLFLIPLLLSVALIGSLISLIGDDSFNYMFAMQAELETRRTKNAELEHYVNGLSSFVDGIRHDDRVLERTSRMELGLARPNEILVIFPD